MVEWKSQPWLGSYNRSNFITKSVFKPGLIMSYVNIWMWDVMGVDWIKLARSGCFLHRG